MQVTQALHRLLQQEPDRPLTIHNGRVRTVAESADRVARLAGALRSAGVGAGDRVGMLSLNSDRYHEFLLAVPWAGAVVNPVNIRWSPAEVAFSLADCDTRVLLVDDAFAPVIPELRDRAPSLQTVIFCGDGRSPMARWPTSSCWPRTRRPPTRAGAAATCTASSTPAGRPATPRG
jgi:acyl-CoA synthetase (AMP-forming)/AMP-acid ligase II